MTWRRKEICCLISLTNLLFINFLFRCAETSAVKLLITDPPWEARSPFVRGIHQSPVDSPHKGHVIWGWDFFIAVCLNKLLNKHFNYQWFEAPWRSCDVRVMRILRSGRPDVRRPHVGDRQAQLLDATVVLRIPGQQAVLPSLKTEGTRLD